MDTLPCYDIFELTLSGPADGNPFIEVDLSASFQQRNRIQEVDGFYDGDGIYRIRCMPDRPGLWRYRTHSSHAALDGITGEFTCSAARPGVHGPVRVADRFHFSYADGRRFVPVGTTCYAWAHQEISLEEQTLETLKGGWFNKMRMCVFPKDYAYNKNEPPFFAFERDGQETWDLNRFNPAFWRHFELRVQQLGELGIEADLILFHPYDRWGFASMPAGADDRYLRYAVARLAAYRNVWWSLANEYDFMKNKTLPDWDRFFQILQEHDPVQHLRSIHNGRVFYDHSKPWVTHASIQHADTNRVKEWRELYRKPIVIDECGYEGDIREGWGNSTPLEHLRRFWTGFCRGGYVGHGETYYVPEEILWWSKGGVLRGSTPERIRFLRQIFEQAPGPLEPTSDTFCAGLKHADEFYLLYLDTHQPRLVTYSLPEGEFKVDIIDTWEMTIQPREGSFQGNITIPLTSKPYQLVRILKIPTRR